MENKSQNLKKEYCHGPFKILLHLFLMSTMQEGPDVMFVIQRVLEAEGNFTLLDKNKVIKQNKFFQIICNI
jgi:hypothetical protein